MFLYIHIPFCESKCKYCRFASIGKTNEMLIEKYVNHLKNDIKTFKTDLSTKSVLKGLKSIYFGGGTPSILNAKYLEEIIFEAKSKFSFQKNIEITLETTPGNITLENIISWEEIGINRISIGVQTLNNLALKEIGREGKGSIFSGLELLKTSKIKNISIDFIIGLPYVKKGGTLKDIKYLLKKYPFIKHISVYMLEDYYDVDIEENENSSVIASETKQSSFLDRHESKDSRDDNKNGFEKITYPENWKNTGINEDDYLKEYLSIRKYLDKSGFNFYELSNSAKNGYECKHNKSYWNHSNNVGFGLGSHSYLNETRYAYKSDFLGYYSGKFEYFEKLDKNDLFLEKVLFSLRTKGIGKKIENKLNKEKINEFIKNGYLKKSLDKIVLGNKGYSVIDFIIKEIV